MEKGGVESGSNGMVHSLNSLYLHQQWFFYLQKRKSRERDTHRGPPAMNTPLDNNIQAEDK